MAGMKVMALRTAASLCAAAALMAHAAAPSAVTLPPQNVMSDRADLIAQVLPNGLNTRANFQWGQTTNYELTVNSLGFDLPYYWDDELSLRIVPLLPGTTYHYRIVATNSSGVALGTNLTFVTLPSGPPAVSIGNATNLTAFSGTLAGVVNPRSLATTVRFEWGTDTNYTGGSTTQYLAAAGVKVPVQYWLNNLAANRTYHFRLVASNSAGLAWSSDSGFTTFYHVAPTVVTAPAVALTTNVATLNGRVNPNGYTASGAFQWGLTTNYGNTTTPVALPAGSSFTPIATGISNLVPGTTYHFRTVATNGSSAFALGPDYTFTTPLYLPPIVATAESEQHGTNSATLHGAVNPNGPSTLAWFQWGPTMDYGIPTTPENIGGGVVALGLAQSISGLTPGAMYHFRVVASNAAGMVYGEDQTFAALLGRPAVATMPASVFPPVPPTLNFPYAFLKGAVQPNNDETTVYFEWGTSASYGSMVAGPSVPAGTTNVPVQAFLYPLTSDSTYHFRIVAYNRAGTNYGADLTFTRPGASGPRLQFRREASGTNVISGAADASRTYVLERTANIPAWSPVLTNTTSADGWLEFRVPAGGSLWFYRVSRP